MKRVIILRGPAGSGKTTLSKELVKFYSGHHFELDKIRKEKVPRTKDTPKYSRKEKAKVNKIIIPLIKEKLEENQIVILDEVFYYKTQLEELMEIFSDEVIVFYLDVPLDLCLERNRQRRLAGERKTTDETINEVYLKTKRLKEGIKIDTANKSVQESLSEIIEYLNSS